MQVIDTDGLVDDKLYPAAFLPCRKGYKQNVFASGGT